MMNRPNACNVSQVVLVASESACSVRPARLALRIEQAAFRVNQAHIVAPKTMSAFSVPWERRAQTQWSVGRVHQERARPRPAMGVTHVKQASTARMASSARRATLEASLLRC